MTSRNDDMHEAEFEDFLQGKGELASLLQDLPQAQPSAELNAAVIAEAERALAAPLATRTAPAMVPPAANDATGPEGSGKPPSFLWRWKLPLSLAASILFAIPVVMQQNQESYPSDPVTVRAPDTTAAPATQEKHTPALPQLAQADLTKQAKVAAEVAPPAAAPAANMNSAAAPAMEASKAKESQVADDARRASAAKPRSEFKRAEQQAEPPPALRSAPAPAPVVAAAPEPATVTITGAAIRRQEMSSAAPVQTISRQPGVEEKVAADSQYANNEKMRAPAANASAAKAEATGMLAKTSETESRSPAAMAEKPVVTASADKKADMPAAVPFPAAQSAPRVVMAPPPVAAAPPLSAALAPEIHPGAYEWLEKIEQLLKNRRNKEALEEWRKFRASYPGFIVDQSLQKQIDALQK
ncbi:hypothetical protein [Undibacterium sp. Tian12W]|uniref:hypothetical protein n=1 Tax=Undibacterium sp. Tian12W TaxID=3413054 RepID=UPI003BF3CA32